MGTCYRMGRARTALVVYEADVGNYPSTEQTLSDLITRPEGVPVDRWDGPYLLREHLVDARGRPFLYRCDSNSYVLHSLLAAPTLKVIVGFEKYERETAIS